MLRIRIHPLGGGEVTTRPLGGGIIILRSLGSGEVKCVMQLARRMPGRHVEGGEIIARGLNLGPFFHRKAELQKNRHQLICGLRQGMDAAQMG